MAQDPLDWIRINGLLLIPHCMWWPPWVVAAGTLPLTNDDTSSSDEDPEPHMVEEIPPMPTRPVPIPELEEDDIVLPDEPEDNRPASRWQLGPAS